MTRYTLIQHSGLDNAVELTSVSKVREIAAIKKAGGLVIDSYSQASELEYEYNYYDTNKTIIPNSNVKGRIKKVVGYPYELFIPFEENENDRH